MYGYTYLTYDTKGDMFYVGQHKSKAYDPKYLGSGVKIHPIIKKRPETLRNYVLEECDNPDDLNESEIRWIEYFRNEMGVDKCYNVSNGGNLFAAGLEITEEHRRKLSEAHKGQISHNKGKCMSEEQRHKLSEAHKGKRHSNETRQKMSEASKGRKKSLAHCQHISAGLMGRVFTKEWKQKISDAHRDRLRTPAPNSRKLF